MSKNIDNLYFRLNQEAEFSGYHLNPDLDFAKDLINGLLINEKRYGYWACPCRLASGDKNQDIDIICPCEYRDQDLDDYGMCYCALYVSKKVLEGEIKISAIPERRNAKIVYKHLNKTNNKIISSFSKPIWRCRVCGYLCGRDNPPEICPICKAKKERFEKFF